ncbi:EAL domain-containing protein [Massilia sp. PAMC28688]|uniref:bifunctional diguanylate cyclase/phosphodiesterase n=1 Tax=Massilia sp. PAMC28688 TaxID=2861283 RepID=UPI001C62FDF7|nr:GGDEF and EAL domain-containing protein [Massilia sp. PAMC28688]QYF92782.1 EAL domain-containing protein [Massilia sp. PAMC28688]
MAWPAHNGEMAGRIRAHDWSATSLGSLSGWSHSLKAAVDMVLQMTMPAILSWGKEDILISNDACTRVDSLGKSTPFACRLRDCAPGNPNFFPHMRMARQRGIGSTCVDQPFWVKRDGGEGPAWFTLNYSPLHDEHGQVAGALAIFFDTTSRVLTERALRDSEQQLSAIFAHAHVGLSLISLEGAFLRVNEELCRMLGRSRDALLACGIAEVTHPDDLPNTLFNVGQLLATGVPRSLDKRYVRPDGTVVSANSSITRLQRGPQGGHVILAVTVDLTERRRAQDALAASEARFRALAEASSALIWQLDEHGHAIYFNPRHETLLGTPPSDLLGTGWAWVIHPQDRAPTLHAIRMAIETHQFVQRRMRVRFADGQWHWMEAQTAPWFKPDGSYAGHVGIAVDIDEAIRAQQELAFSNERLKLAIEGSGDGIWDWDLVARNVVYSERAREIFHLDQDNPEDPATFLDHCVHPEDRESIRAELRACLSGQKRSFRSEFRVATDDAPDSWRWVMTRATVVGSVDGRNTPQRMIGTVTDIAEKRRSEEIVWRHANHDLLTGLPNRRLFRDRLDLEIRKSQRSGLPLALLFIDLDRFKEANDLLGHTIGDQVLVEAARRICGCVRSSDTVARLGGDEFTAILAELDGAPHVDVVAEKINAALGEPFYLGNEVVYLSASIGVTLYPADAADAENLIRNADQAMYAVKNEGRNHFSYFTPSMQHEANERLRLISDLRVALATGQLQVHYQPIIDLATGKVSKAEALLRWEHPVLGMIEPVRFIGFAEETGLISEIGDWVFREAAWCAREWGRRLGTPFTVSINKSPVQFISRLNEVSWPDYLAELGLTGTSVSVEITEGVLLDASPIVSAKLLQYHDAGIKVAIDDFGTGYSSIAYLKKFAVDFLKIDQSFVRDIGGNGGDRAIVRSIIAMAHELGLQVIAEGIETVEQKEWLIEGQCDFGQGFLFSRAVPASEFERLLCAEL